MAEFKTTQIYGDLYVNNKLGIGTISPSTSLSVNGTVSASAVTSDAYQFGYNSSINKTDSYTISDAENGKLVIANSGSNLTVTLSTSVSPAYSCTLYQSGSGRIVFSAGAASMKHRLNYSGSAGQYAMVSVVRVPNGDFVLGGDLS